MKQVDQLMRTAVEEKVFPGGVLLVSKDSETLFSEAYGCANGFTRSPMTRETVFDLASLTKPLGTTLAVMTLIREDKLHLNQSLESILPSFKGTNKAQITIRHLLCHNSGFADYRPYYLELAKSPLKERKEMLHHLLSAEKLSYPTGSRTVYSDLGFMVLHWVVEAVSEQPMDQLLTDEIYTPVGCDHLFFPGLDAFPKQLAVAATEKCPWRNTVLQGEVHDENAWAIGGVAGHAGLFGTAADIDRLIWDMLGSYYNKVSTSHFDRSLLRTFFERQPDADRALGFDIPASENASCGRYFSGHTIGHLGFTGTSFWVDLEKAVVVILLTNRVHPSRDNIQIRAFRPQVHDVVMEGIGI